MIQKIIDFFSPPVVVPVKAESLMTETYNAISAKVANYVNDSQAFLSSVSSNIQHTLSEMVKGTVIGNSYLATANLIKNNTLNISYAAAAIGGLAVVDSTINLVQKKADDNLLLPKPEMRPMNEALKILAGSALIGLSVAFGANDNFQRATIVNAALGLGLVNAAWRAAIVVKPTFLVFQLKSLESNTPVKNVAVFPS